MPSPPTALLLFNLGGPATLDDVKPFLVRLFSDPDIIELPLGRTIQPLFARLLAHARAGSVRRNYARIGGGSPQLPLTRAQAAALEHRLNGGATPGRLFRSYVAMRYARPFIADTLGRIQAAGLRRVVAVSLFPHYSRATTGSWLAELSRILSRPEWSGRFDVSVVDAYPTHPLYLDALADTVRTALNEFPAGVRDRVVILFSTHGLPQKLVDTGDPYVEQIEATRRELLARLGLPNRQLLGYQSRTGPVRWTGPGTDEQIARLGREGVRELLVVPLSFVSDHIETLYELDILFADLARRAGIATYRRTASLNTHPLFVEALADLVEKHLAEPGFPEASEPVEERAS